MMRKLLIVSEDALGHTLQVILFDWFDYVVLTNQGRSLETFLDEQPSHVLIAALKPEDKQVYQDILSADVGSKIFRYGFDNKADMKFPLSLNEIKHLLE